MAQEKNVVNEKIAKALAEDVKRRSSNGGTFEFHDDDAVYTVSVRVERTLNKSLPKVGVSYWHREDSECVGDLPTRGISD